MIQTVVHSSEILALFSKRFILVEAINRSALFLVMSLCIVNLQAELTANYKNIDNYVAGQMGPIFTSRVFTRWILQTLSAPPIGLPLASANYWLQSGILFLSFSFIYIIGANLSSKVHGLAATLVSGVMLPWGFLSSGYSVSYPYDFPSFLVTTLGLYAIIKHFDLLFYFVLVIGTLNKETSVWLIPIFIFYNKAEKSLDIQIVKKLLITVAVYIGSYFVIRYALYGSLILNNSSRFFSTHQNSDPRFLLNLAQLIYPFRGNYSQWLYFPFLINILPLLDFKHLPKILKCAYLAVPFYLVPIFIVGNINEFRLLNEILPVASLALPYGFSRYASIK